MRIDLPVWMYWEGEKPEWISMCEETVKAHGRDVRVLGLEDMRGWQLGLGDPGPDADLSHLHVAHRSDVIRAYLLQRYGGLWIDSDCIVMKDLQPVLDLLEGYDFVGYREIQGHVSNNFMASRPGGKIITAYYQAICEILKTGRQLGWLTLGAHSLTRIIKILGEEADWIELSRKVIQPVSWSRPWVFFKKSECVDWVGNEEPICYMLANQAMQKWQLLHPNHCSLTDAGTFFRHLIRKAMEINTATTIDTTTTATTRKAARNPFIGK